ncbi:flagellin [Bradyrhizobium lablabi]|uniref:flagellin N-terminal helical domain-containing protein n=1 Tax=Bradyrhizobium lablabi TaxID=722472 RepID=UPI001BAE52C1|nr:flagellin [Bradyrhizobium lablabi]MBR1125408.1 flagellin [Bradyrhizobium lablabi]
MSGIVLSASVRQNLLSLQSTADLLATTQNRLATGKKVNSALDNPTNFFTASSLDSRASDINNLLDGIGNGVQVLQAANTGITSLQKLVDSAKSIANQALQTPVGYVKSTATSAASSATAANLLAGTPQQTSSVNGSVLYNNVTQSYTATTSTPGAVRNNNHLGAYTAPTHNGTAIPGAINGTTQLSALTTPPSVGDTLTVNGTTWTITGAGGLSDGTHISVDDTLTSVMTKIQGAAGAGASVSLVGGAIQITGSTSADLVIGQTGTAAADLGLTPNTYARGNAATTPAPVTLSTSLAGAASPTSDALDTANQFTTADTLVVNGVTIHFFDSGNAVPQQGPTDATNKYIDLATATLNTLKTTFDAASGGSLAVNGSGQFTITTGLLADVTIGGSAVAKLGLTAGTQFRTSAPATAAQITGNTTLKGPVGTDSLTSNFSITDTIVVNTKTIAFFDSTLGGVAGGAPNTTYFDLATADVNDVLAQIDAYSGGTGSAVSGGKVTLNAGTTAALDISGTGLAKLGLTAGITPASTPANAGLSGKTLTIGATGGGVATSITFGTGAGEVSDLNELNAALAANNLQASINTTGKITLTTTNAAASYNIGALGGTATDPGGIFNGVSVVNTVADPDSQATRASLVAQYNQTIEQIRTTAQDSSFNGINLLNGDTLKLTFNETGKSTLTITGVNFDPAGLGLSSLVQGTDFIDNSSTNKILESLNAASSTLRSQASAFGSNLSIVQIRQDFSKNLINVLQTGSSNLTLADTNEEAANSQALSTRQSIAVSALALANQSQQSVLQLLR